MSKPIIEIQRLSKRYRLGEIGAGSLREAVNRLFRSGGRQADETKILWALKDISLSIERGEIVGVIGRNGAGKSTLLKILSRITDPTEGRAILRGRVASLLEVGTGFHPELTGRENIYLNGSILGMRKREIDRKFDEIVAFAELDKFLDTPVKHYSSGMYVRLGFAVAAHLEQEILFVDEVLAVGDLNFQKKCLDKMQAVHEAGRTVIFISHNLSAVARLCRRTLLLENGGVAFDGATEDTLREYMRRESASGPSRRWSPEQAPGDDTVKILEVLACSADGKREAAFNIDQDIAVEIEFEVLRDGKVIVPNFIFNNDEGACLFAAHDTDPAWRGRARQKGRYRSRMIVSKNLLKEGGVSVSAALSTYNPLTIHAQVFDAVSFRVVDTFPAGSSRGDYTGVMPGAVQPAFEWTTEFKSVS